jgi:hypothetical protein
MRTLNYRKNPAQCLDKSLGPNTRDTSPEREREQYNKNPESRHIQQQQPTGKRKRSSRFIVKKSLSCQRRTVTTFFSITSHCVKARKCFRVYTHTTLFFLNNNEVLTWLYFRFNTSKFLFLFFLGTT